MSLTIQEEVIKIAYGTGHVPLRMDDSIATWDVIRPTYETPLADGQAAFSAACREPYGTAPLRELVSPNDRVLVVTSDGTRPVPNKLLMPWLLEELQIAPEQVTVMLGTGTHRANTPGEIAEMFGADLAKRLTFVNNDARDDDAHELVGTSSGGVPGYVDKRYLEADKRIVLGFIEPHLFAGFSGGGKGVVPGISTLKTILPLHRYELLANPLSTWGQLDGNPVRKELDEIVRMCAPEFMINVTLNMEKEITGVFAGDFQEAHRAGCARAKAESMVPVEKPYPIVVASNSGYPLDQNLYQTLKGMSAASRIVEKGGTVFMASECRDGFPDHGDFRGLLNKIDSAESAENFVRDLKELTPDQWQIQIMAGILGHANIVLHSTLSADEVSEANLTPTDNLQSSVEDAIRNHGPGCRVAVMPDGPLTIPYLAG